MKEALSRRHRVVLAALCLCLVVMVTVLVVERMRNPSLVVHKNLPMQAMPGAPSAEKGGQTSGMPALPEMGEIGALMQMVKANPGDIALKNKLAEALMAQDQWDAAENFLVRARTQDPKNAKSAFLLGIVRHKKGDFHAAERELVQSLALADEPDTRYSLAMLYLYFLQNRDKGLALLREGLAGTTLTPEMRARFQEELTKNSTDRP